MMRWLCAALLLGLPGQTALGIDFFDVVHVEGQLLWWQDDQLAWIPVTGGQKLPAGALLQSSSDIDVLFREAGPAKPMSLREEISVASSSPLIFRLDVSLLRQITTANYFLPKEGSSKPKKDAGPDTMHIEDAWERVVSYVSTGASQEGVTTVRFGSPSAQDVHATKTVRRIDIQYPQYGGAFLVDSLPLHVPAVWTAVGKGQHYDVWLRGIADRSAKRIGTTDDTSFELVVPKEGGYAVKITTKDGEWSSKDQIFHVKPIMSP